MSTYSPSLRIQLIATGDQAGTWGNTTNTNLGTLIEAGVAGYVSVSVTSANQAFTALDGAADQARNMTIALTTTTGAAFNVYAPPVEKTYVIYNASLYDATIYNSTIIGNTTAAGVGVTIPAGKVMTVWTEGTNFAVQNSHIIGTVVGNVTGNVTGQLDGSISSATTATTQSPGTNTTQVATTAFVGAAVTAATGSLGTMSTQNANNVNITGGTITGSYGLTAANATNATTATNQSGGTVSATTGNFSNVVNINTGSATGGAALVIQNGGDLQINSAGNASSCILYSDADNRLYVGTSASGIIYASGLIGQFSGTTGNIGATFFDASQPNYGNVGDTVSGSNFGQPGSWLILNKDTVNAYLYFLVRTS
jgi:hypothetical protein